MRSTARIIGAVYLHVCAIRAPNPGVSVSPGLGCLRARPTRRLGTVIGRGRPGILIGVLAGAITVTRRRFAFPCRLVAVMCRLFAVARSVHPVVHRVEPVTGGLPRRGIFRPCLIPDGGMHVALCRIVVTLRRTLVTLLGFVVVAVFLAHAPMLPRPDRVG